MIRQSETNLLARNRTGRYSGRIAQIEQLYLDAVSGTEPYLVRVSGAPSVGTSEMLRRVYDRLFLEQRFVVPFYFALRSGDGNARSAAARYAYDFLLQAIAFRRKDANLLSASPDICELAKLAPLADADWVRQLCEVCENKGPLNDDRAFIRAALAAPLRAATLGKFRACIIIDDLHESAAIDSGRGFLDLVSSLAAASRSPVILAARRRFSINGKFRKSIEIGPLDRADASQLIDDLATDSAVFVSEQARDLIAVQLGGKPFFIQALLDASHQQGREIRSYRDVQQLYSSELLGGRIAQHFDEVFRSAAPDPGVRRTLVEMFYLALEPGTETFLFDSLRDRLSLDIDQFDRLVGSLVVSEVISVSGGSVSLESDGVLRDYLEARFRLDRERDRSATVTAAAITNALKRAPRLMANAYRSASSVGLRALMLTFDMQEVPRGALDYRVFSARYKGLSGEDIRMQMAAEDERITLPQIAHAEPLANHLPPFREVIEPDRVIAGIGFADRTYRDDDEITWLAAEIDSKLEADHALTLEWCNRLSEAAQECGFSNYRIWLVAPEGFTSGALELLSERNAIGSSRRQVALLRETLLEEKGGESEVKEYEIVIPIGEDTELIAAHTLEEISRRYDFPAKAVNQIKTALVEACINAAEHSLSPDQKIHQKFAIYNDRIVITVSNRGLRLADLTSTGQAAENDTADTRRGWGLNLMRTLMDEVRVESVDDGTRLVMTKYLTA